MDADPGENQSAPEGSQPSAEKLKAYVTANAFRFTDEAITAELTKAGYAADDIEAALEEARRGYVAPPKSRAVATILVLYGLTFALLSLGMFANSGVSGGPYMPNAVVGILILAGSLGFALLLSFAWVGNRRAAGFVFAVLLGIYGLGSLASGGLGGIILLGAAVALFVLVVRRGAAPTTRSTATLAALLSVPVILLVIVAGLCLATGLPIPRFS